MPDKVLKEGLTFDDVLLVPARSDVIPGEADIRTQLTRRISLNIPLISAPMDTVTEYQLAIALAREGGIGIIHKNMTTAQQAEQIGRVKRYESGLVSDPVTLSPDDPLSAVLDVMQRHAFSGIPVTEDGVLCGIITNRDLRFQKNLRKKIRDIMTPREKLVTAPVGVTVDRAKRILMKHRIEKLPVVDRAFRLRGLITVKDIMKNIQFPNACKDRLGRLRVGAAVGVNDGTLARVGDLIKADVDVVVVDSSHGHNSNVVKTVAALRKKYRKLQLIAGNVVTPEGVRDLAAAGADAVKVGIGPGSICTTRVVTGAGMPQVSAILACAKAARKARIPIIADGGIKYSGDITKALAAGAGSVMVGNLFAGTAESPGETILYEGRTYKAYRGMGSLGAMEKGSKDRYFQENADSRAKMVPEGIEGMAPFKGDLADSIFQLVGGLRAGMGLCGCRTVADLARKAKFVRVTQAGVRENHPHDVMITKEAPNYQAH